MSTRGVNDPVVDDPVSNAKSRNAAQPSRSTIRSPSTVGGQTTWAHWACLGLVVTLLPYSLSKLHYSLPDPLPPVGAGGPQPSEELVLNHIRALETIGYRTVGTPQARRGELYVEEQVRALERQCQQDGVSDCTVYVQTGDGFHEFSIMDHDVSKVYKGITNIILQIRAKHPPSGPRTADKDAILLGSHIDSTLPAPGAADDGMGVGVMSEIARVSVERKQPFDNSVIFLWNGGEETLQDGSHLYTNSHPTAKEVHAAINLEAAGTTGGASLFQATSKEMVEAFAYAPYPRGTVIAADVFASGILMSDTDFVQFEQYLNISGLDMAIVGHSYFYHTQKDRIEFIERGAAQHFASNVQAILDHLSSTDSPSHSTVPWSPPHMVYLTMYDRFFLMYSMETATKIHTALGALVVAIIGARMPWRRPKVIASPLLGTILGLVGGVVTANLAAGVMVLSDRQSSWFKHEHLCLVLFAPAGLIGHLSTQLLLSRRLSPSDLQLSESTHYHSQSIFATFNMLLSQASHIRSAYIFAMIVTILLVGAIGDVAGKSVSGRRGKLSFGWSYISTMSGFVILGVEAVTTTSDIFTPLVGRMGKDAPAEFIIATISSICTIIFTPPLSPSFHRFSRPAQRRVSGALGIFTVAVIVLFAGPWWNTYDSMHPKRAGFQYTYNHTTATHTANIAFMDSGPELDFVEASHERYGAADSPIENTHMSKANSDWDVLYPISSFLDTYRFDLPSKGEFAWPEMGIQVIETHGDGTRKLDMTLNFTGLVWPTLAFNAEILDWSFDFTPPHGLHRHHLKIATGVESPVVDSSLTIRDQGEGPLNVHWIAIDLNQMVPGTAAEMGPDMPGSKVLLDSQEWAKVKYDDSLEISTYAAVAGSIEL